MQLKFSVILYWFQVYNIVVRQSYTLESVLPYIWSTNLAPYPVITIFFTVFPMLCFYIPVTVS